MPLSSWVQGKHMINEPFRFWIFCFPEKNLCNTFIDVMYIDFDHWSILSACGSDIVTGIVTTAGWKQMVACCKRGFRICFQYLLVQKNEPFCITALTEAQRSCQSPHSICWGVRMCFGSCGGVLCCSPRWVWVRSMPAPSTTRGVLGRPLGSGMETEFLHRFETSDCLCQFSLSSWKAQGEEEGCEHVYAYGTTATHSMHTQ